MKRSGLLLVAAALAVGGCSSSPRSKASSANIVLPTVPTYTSSDAAEAAVCSQSQEIITTIGDNYDKQKYEVKAYVLVKTAQQAETLAGAADTYASQLYNASVLLRQQIIKGHVETDGDSGPIALLGGLCR